MGRKRTFLEFWRSKEEIGARLERADQLKLLPSQLKRLHGDSAVRAALQNVRAASLLPPVGTEVFRRLTPALLEEIQKRHAAESLERETRTKNKEEVDKDHSKPARDLEAGKPLPFFYGDPPSGHLRTPLEELDPYYQSQKTFIVLGRGNIIQRFNAEPALYIISSAVRTVAIKILSHYLFSALILLTILINCFFMMLQSSHHAAPPLWARVGEIVFTIIYTLEVMVKVVSRGFCVGRFTFLRDPWNWLDVMVVITAYLGLFLAPGKFLVLTTISRVLKIIPLVPGLKMASDDFKKALRRLAGVFALTAFVLSVLSVIGLQTFMGSLRQKCIKLPTQGNQSSLNYDYSDNNTGIILFDYTRHVQDPANHHYRVGNLDPLLCGNASDAGRCPEGFTCVRAGQTPNYGYTSYDAFGPSLLSSFRLMTQDFWDNLMLLTLRANGKMAMKMFVLVFFPGCFLLVSLIVSKFAMVIGEQVEARVAEANQKHEEFGQIVEALKRREEEEEEAASGAALSEAQRGENENDHTASEGQQQQRQSSCPLCCLFLGDLFLKRNCCGCCRWLKQRLYSVVTNPFFDFCIVICLILDIIFMAIGHYPMTWELESDMSLALLVFTLIFTLEMLVKMVAMGPCNYFKVSWNIFESIIVALTLLELMLADVERMSMLRIFRLARWWPCFRLLLKIVWASVRALRNPTLLLVIVSFIFTVVGWQLFHDNYKDCVCRIAADCQLPRWHMEDFFHTFLLVVRSLCGQWIETLWDCMEVSGKPLCLTFFMTLVVFGDLLILNLFLILLLNPLNGDSLLTITEEKNNNVHTAIRQIKGAICGSWSRIRGNKSHHTAKSQGDSSKDYMALTVVPEDQPASKQMELKTPEDQKTKTDNVQKQREVQPERDGGEHQGDEPEDCCSPCCCPFLDVDTSQGVGKVWANFRRGCFRIARHKCFDVFIIVIIILSTVAMMFENIYLHEGQILKTAVDIIDLVCTCLFLLEMLLKWIGFGLKKYFTDAWCWLDFLILDVFLVSIMADKLGFSVLGTFQFLRTLRALGPLRLLSRFQGLRLVVQVLVQAIPTMFAGLLVIITTWLFFSILGTVLFAGKFHYCFNETSEEYFLNEVVANKSDCVSLIYANYTEVRWKGLKLNYDNVMNGYVSLLHLALSEDWMDVMYAAVDSTWVEEQPVYESNLYVYLYFVIFAISCFYSLNFFLRFIITGLQKAKLVGKHIFMTEDQVLLSRTMRRLLPKKTHKTFPRPQNRCQAWVFDLVTKPCFEFVMVVVICLNMVCMMADTYDQSMETEHSLYFVHFSFIIIFLVEFVVKVIALRKHYFHDGWNIIDFVVLIMTISEFFIGDLMANYFLSPYGFPILRVGRISRLLYVIPPARGIRKLLLGFVTSLPALFNIVVVLLLLNVTFSIFGMFNFGHVKEGAILDDMYNFKTFGNSMICMFMVSVSGGWGGLLYPILDRPPDCDPYQENPGLAVVGDCGWPILGIIFFSTYVTLTFLLAICLYITVILGTYNYEGTEILSDKDLQKFHNTWMKYDPDASQFMPYSKLSEFCDSLQDPLRIPKPNAVKLTHMDLPLCLGDKVHCVDVLMSLAKQVSGDAREMNFLKARVEKMFGINSSQVPYVPTSSTLRRKREEVAAKVIQRAYRKGLLRHGEGQKAEQEPVNGI